MYWWQRLILIVLMVATSVLIALPANSLMLTDYGKPTEAWWEEPEKEQEEGEEEKELTAVVTFAEWDSFIGRLWFIIPLILALGITYLILSGYWYDQHHLDAEVWLIAPLVLQVVLILVGSVAVVIVNSYYFDVPARLAEAISDEKLAEKAVAVYRERQVLIPFLVFVCFLVSDIVIVLALCGIGVSAEKLHEAYTGYKRSLVESLQGDSHSLVLRTDGTVERARYAYRFRWLPFPAVVPERSVTGELAWVDVCKLLARAVSASSMEALCRQFKISLADLFDAIGDKTSGSIVIAIGDKVRHKMNGQLTQAVQRDEEAAFDEASGLLQGTSDKTLKRFQQDLVSSVSKAVGSHLSDFRQRAIQFMEAKAAGSATFVPHDGLAFPPDTKFCLAKGKMTVFVIEEQPQTRSVMFRRGFWRGRDRHLRKDTSFQLAFPYVIFVVRLVENQFTDLCVFYSKEPLRSLTDKLCWPNLPNVYTNGSVCLNLGSDSMETSAQEVEAAISHFWQSTFNNDLRKSQYEKPNPVKDVWEWQEKSQADPSFVLTADWRERDKPIEKLIERLLKGEGEDEVAITERRVRQSLSSAMEGLTAVVHAACSDISVEERYSKVVAKEMAGHLQSLGTAVLDCMVTQLNDAVADTNSNVRHQYDYHLQREVNNAVAQTFFSEAAAALLEKGRLPDSVYHALDERRDNE